MQKMPAIAYFSMEIGLEAAMPTYSGGLGILAGDTIRSAADLGIPLIAVTLLHRKGYFYQRLDKKGDQSEEAVEWTLEGFLTPLEARVVIHLEGRQVTLRAWQYDVRGQLGATVPVLLLDTDIEDNDGGDRRLTDTLYGGDQRYRLCQEAILGIGGIRMLRALGYKDLRGYHMNEGHASLLTLELLNEQFLVSGRREITPLIIEAVRRQCLFTTHTPVPAGHDQFPMDLVKDVLGDHEVFSAEDIFCCDDRLNMTYLALNLSHYVNGVAKRHGEISRHMFANYQVDSITNGVHVDRWTAAPFKQLFDRHIPGWREDNFSLRYALSIPGEEIWEAHLECKRALVHYVNRIDNIGLDLESLTVGFARRATAYKRPDLIFADLDRLRRVAADKRLQLVFAGKAHPQDSQGKGIIRAIFAAAAELQPQLKVVYLPNYDMELGALLTSGVDLWLNTPQPPMEASGTSGMKAALNGVPSLSVLDGWWIEGCIEGVTGWAIGTPSQPSDAQRSREQDARFLYDKLEGTILPLYYDHSEGFHAVMAHAIALNGSFFNTQRMVQQYVLKAYFGAESPKGVTGSMMAGAIIEGPEARQ